MSRALRSSSAALRRSSSTIAPPEADEDVLASGATSRLGGAMGMDMKKLRSYVSSRKQREDADNEDDESEDESEDDDEEDDDEEEVDDDDEDDDDDDEEEVEADDDNKAQQQQRVDHHSLIATNGTHASTSNGTHDDNTVALVWFKRVNDLFKTKVPGTHNLVRGVTMPSNAPLPPVNLPPLPPLKNSTAKPGLPRRPLAAKGLPGSGSSAATSTPAAKKARPAAPVVAAAVAPPVAAVPVPLPPPVVASAPVTGKRERGSNTSRNAAAQHASSSVADEREDGEVADQETATEATEWLKRESKRAEADKTFAEIVGTASPKRARHSPRPGDNSKPVRAAKAAAAIAVTKSSTSRTASNTTTTATSTASTAAVTATSVTPVESAPPPPVATRSAASSRTRSAGNDTTATTAATATTAKTSSTLTAKQQRDNMQSQAKKLKHLGDAMLKDAADLQDRKEAYQSLLSAGLLWLEVVSLSDEPRPLLKQTADYFSYHVGNLDALPRYASCFLRCRAVTLAQLARCQDTENSKQMCAQAKKQLDGARREVKAHSSEIGATLRKLVAADGAAEQVVRLCDAVNDAREKWARAVQLWQAEGGTPLAWPGDGDFLAMSLQDFVDFVRKNLAQLLGE